MSIFDILGGSQRTRGKRSIFDLLFGREEEKRPSTIEVSGPSVGELLSGGLQKASRFVGKNIQRGAKSLLGRDLGDEIIEQPKQQPIESLLQREKPRVSASSEIPQSTSVARNPAISRYKISDDVNNAIAKAAAEFDMPSDLLYDIALHESGFNPSIQNVTPDGVAAGNPKGLFQFTDGTWDNILKQYNDKEGSSLHLPKGKDGKPDRFDPYTNALAAAYLIKFGQLGKWDASKDRKVGDVEGWGRFYDEEELKPYYTQTLDRQ